MPKLSRCSVISIAALASVVLGSNAYAAITYQDVESFISPSSATEMIYAPQYRELLLLNSGSAIKAIDLNTRSSTTQLSNSDFTDMSRTPNGRYVYAADYGGENIGYGTPAHQNYVHRFDLQTGTWAQKPTSLIAGRIAAVSSDSFVLSSTDQWVTFSYNSWGTGNTITPLNSDSFGGTPGAFYPDVYRGDIEYDPATGRLIHGNSGLSSQEITAFKIAGNEFHQQETSGTYGSASGYGGSSVLATDGSAFYYGALQVDPLDVAHNLHTFPEKIYAASGSIAFGDGRYYDAHTGALLGSLGFDTQVYALGADGKDFWAFDAADNTLHHFVLGIPEPSSFAAMLLGLPALALWRRRARKSVESNLMS